MEHRAQTKTGRELLAAQRALSRTHETYSLAADWRASTVARAHSEGWTIGEIQTLLGLSRTAVVKAIRRGVALRSSPVQ